MIAINIRSFKYTYSSILLFIVFFLTSHIQVHAATTLYVGTGIGNYPTIADAYAACNGPGDTYTIEILSSYSDTETKPINLSNSPADSITIQPELNNTNCIISNNNSLLPFVVFSISDQSVTIDGRPGGSSTTNLMTIQNSSYSAPAILLNNSDNITILYCNIRGVNRIASSLPYAGVVYLSNTRHTTIDNCNIQGTAIAKPTIAVFAEHKNDDAQITNCNIFDFTSAGILVFSDITSNVNWTIQGNSLYHTGTITTNGKIYMIRITSGSNYDVKNNYLGGQAPLCASSPYTLTGQTTFYGIVFEVSTSGNNTISNNFIKNITMTTTSDDLYGFTGIALSGTNAPENQFECNENVIGDMNSANNITYINTNLTTSGFGGFCAINENIYNSYTLSHNSIGGIKITTNAVAAKSNLILINNIGQNEKFFETNTLGSASAPIENAGIGELTLILNRSRNFSCIDNTIENIKSTNPANSNNFTIFKNTGINTFVGGTHITTGNTVRNITSTSNSPLTIFQSDANATATFSDNTVHTLSANITNSATHGIAIFDILNSSKTVTINNNTIGTTTPNNIQLLGDNLFKGIFGTNSSIIVNGNTLQNITLSNPINNFGFVGIGFYANNINHAFQCESNTIKSIRTTTTNNADTCAPIYVNASGAAHSIRKNTIDNIAFTNTAATAQNSGMYLHNSSGTGASTVEGNMITGLSNASNSGSVLGMYVHEGIWNIQNNMLLLNNAGGAADASITGVSIASTLGVTMLSNTVKIYGTQTGIHGSVACNVTTSNSNVSIKNNIFQNIRQAGSIAAYAIKQHSTSILSNYNYLESATPNTICNKAGLDYTFASWKIDCPNSITGATSIDNVTGKIGSAFAGAAKALPISTITADFFNTPRTATPWMGAYEGVQILTTNIATPLTFCSGASVTIPFVVSGTITPTNYTYTAQLSNANGSFASPTILASAPSSAASITATIPYGISSGTKYRIRVITSIAGIYGTDNGVDILIDALANLPVISLSPLLAAAGRPYTQTCLVTNVTNQVWSTTSTIPGLTLGTDGVLTGIPSTPGIFPFAIKVDGGQCSASTTLNFRVLDLVSPNLKFAQPAKILTYGKDTLVTLGATSLNSNQINYSIKPLTNGCVSLVNDQVKVICVPSTDVWLVAQQTSTLQYAAAKDSIKIIVNKATPVVTLTTLRGTLTNTSTTFAYLTPTDYTGTGSYSQTDGFQFANLAPNGTITGVAAGAYQINLKLTATSNYLSLDTTFNLFVYRQLQAPQAIADTITLIRDNDVIEDGTIDILLNDYGITDPLQFDRTDMDVINAGIQPIFFDPNIGSFDLDVTTGILTVYASKGMTGTASIGYTVSDSSGLTSAISYIYVIVFNKQVIPSLKANEIMTPNNDNKNDALYIGYSDMSKNNSLIISDEIGNEIYKTSNYQNDWTGVNQKGNALAPGIYYYTFTEEDGSNRILNGYVQLIR